MKNRKKAQSVLEYSLLIAVIVGAVITMQVYMKRSMQGQIQVAGEQLGSAYSHGHTNLHERTQTHVKTVNWALPAPVNRIKSSGSYNFTSDKQIKLDP